MITHYDLFAGIGGFSLALEEVFSDETIRHIFCEWESFPTSVLKRHWPDGEFWGDINGLVAYTGRKYGQAGRGIGLETKATKRSQSIQQHEQHNFTIVTGGFPCQPFSAAGRRKGTADDRYQWPNMFAVIRHTKPEWVIAENVRGLVTWNEGLVLETVCADLESEGYEVQPFIIPAVAVGAPHRRDRVWIIANKRSAGLEETGASQQTKGRGRSSRRYPDWSRAWQEVAFKTCHDGLDDGLSREVGGLSYSAAKWRKEGLRAYGNAIVPQVAMQIMEAIRDAHYEVQE